MVATPAARLRTLTEENRRGRDAERERELVALRHRAGCERMGHPGPLRPVRAGSSRLEFEGGLPVVQCARLDASTAAPIARRAISEHGSLLVRDLISPGAVRHLVAVVDRVFASFDAKTDGSDDEHESEQDEWFRPFPGRNAAADATRAWLRTKGGILTGDSPRATFEVADVLISTGIARLAEQYLGQPPILSLDKWTIRRGSAEQGIEWHQDGAFLGDGVRALNVWLALSECGTGAPSLDVVPRRLDEIVKTGGDGASYSWSVADDDAARVAGPDGWSRPCFGPGDALLFDDKLLHRTGGSPDMTQTRYAIETWFFAPSGDTDYVEVPLIL